MAKIENLQRLIDKLRDRAAKSRKDDNCSVSVGYTAAYALYVHENRNVVHAGQQFVSYASGKRREYTGVGKAGFLLDPARRLSPQLASITAQARQRGLTMAQALLLAGLRLQRESQLECPVDTGAMKASAFTRLDPNTGG